MRGHGIADLDDRGRALQEHKQEILGKLPAGPFEFSASLNFEDLAPNDDDPPVVRRFKLAVKRDAKYATASAPYLQLFGLSQALRSVYDGGGQTQDGRG